MSDAVTARRALEDLPRDGCGQRHSGDPPIPASPTAVERYVELLLAANARLNLTRIVAPAEVARLHLLDALSALPLLDALAPDRALDLGSGGGVPGLVLALARRYAWTLVDSVGRKADALRGFVDALGLRNVVVIAERAEVLGRDARPPARSTWSPPAPAHHCPSWWSTRFR